MKAHNAGGVSSIHLNFHNGERNSAWNIYTIYQTPWVLKHSQSTYCSIFVII